jgi:hypothetical protein
VHRLHLDNVRVLWLQIGEIIAVLETFIFCIYKILRFLILRIDNYLALSTVIYNYNANCRIYALCMVCLHFNVFLTQNKIAKMDLETTTIVMQFLLLDMTCKYEKLVKWILHFMQNLERQTAVTLLCVYTRQRNYKPKNAKL